MKHSISALLFLFVLTACDDGKNKTEPAATDTASQSTTATASDASPATPAAINTSDAAIAVLENENVRFKLHSLNELTPDPSAPGKPEAGKTYYVADISVEYLKGTGTTPAEYMLTANIVDDKGGKHSLAMESIKLAMISSSADASAAETAGASFNQRPTAGATFRGRQYGVVLDKGTRPVEWTITLDEKQLSAAVR